MSRKFSCKIQKNIKGNFFILQLDFVVSRCQIESYQNASCMMSHLDLSYADDMLILIDLKFCLFRGSFGSFGPFFGLFEGLSLLCWWFRPLIGPLTHPIDARLLPGKVEKHRKGWITIEKRWIAEVNIPQRIVKNLTSGWNILHCDLFSFITFIFPACEK